VAGPLSERYPELYSAPPVDRTPLDEQLDYLVFKNAAEEYTPFISSEDITGDRDRGTDILAHCRAYAARCMHPDIDSDPELHRFLSRFEDQLDRLGFEPDDDGTLEAPSREALRRFRQKRVTDEWLEDCLGEDLSFQHDLAISYGYEEESPKAEVTDYAKEPDLVSTNEIQNAYETLTPHLDHIEDGRDQAKVQHPWGGIKDILGNASAQKTSCSDIITDRKRPENQQEYELVQPHEVNEPGDISIKQFFEALDSNSATKYMKCFEYIFKEFLEEATDNGMFTRPVDLMIDGTKFVYNPKVWEDGKPQLPEGLVGTGSNEYSYRFITVSVYDRENNKTMKPISFPMRERSQLFLAVSYIIRMLDPYMSIREVFADSEFATGPILNFLEDRSIDYTFRYKKSGDDIKSWLKGMSGNEIAGAMDYTINEDKDHPKRHETRLLAKRVKRGKPDMSLPKGQHSLDSFVSEEGQLDLEDFDRRDIEDYDGPWFVYVTSHDVPNDRESVREKLKQYASRWNVETDYRVVKQNFMPHTNTDKYAVRVLFWFWAVSMYNAWVLADILIKLDREWDLDEDYSVRSKPFRRAITDVSYG
jgi:hypothetical protein